MAGQAPFQSPGGNRWPFGERLWGDVPHSSLPDRCLHLVARNQELASWSGRKLEVEFRRIQWDLHSALGFWSFPFIFIWAISGVYFAFPGLFNAVFPPDSLALLWLSDLHFGRFNLATKAVWSVVGLVPAVLAFTGVFVCCRRIIFHKLSNPNL